MTTSVDPGRRVERDTTESETRFRVMADHAPVLLWMAGTDGLCNFFNQRWLDFTGRPLELEVGSGWAGGVHPEDFQHCMARYFDAFVARKSFSMEYRLRRHDGVYRWVYDQGAPRFEQDGRFAGFIGSCTDVTEQRLARDALGRQTLELEDRVRERTAIAREREVLLREVHHRVKNDLQLISSLLSMQGRRLTDPHSVMALAECQSRVQTIALIHEYMYQSENLARLPLSRNIRGLAANLLRVVGPPDRPIRLEVDVEDDLELPVDRAIPCGLILNELMTNALKHAFPEGRPGTLRITLRKEGPDHVALAVSDDGVGLPDAHDNDASGSLGWRLVKAFAEQLGAELRVTASPGTKVEVVFRTEG
ncbi:MAG TPA: histidine kinase dimerization/phosphoacceptor domain -containing protein [Polyangiaceae bacterium]|jgi:PAS domain S-box-containing protein|nr:histidine kinase dimerization/phosphoacceptor domain -containing protein [Polyangiaceae bacterium]